MDTSEFGKALQHQRKKVRGLTQEELWKQLNERLGSQDGYGNCSIVCKWERGKCIPKRGVVEILDSILSANGELLDKADYPPKGVGDQGRPASRSRQTKSDHFNCLADVAGELLAGELDTVARRLPSLPSDDPEVTFALTYNTQYVIGKDEKRRDIRGGRITQMLMSNWHSAYDQVGEPQVNSLMSHLMAELPGSLRDELTNLRSGRPVFERLAVTQPFWLIYTLRKLRDSKELKGTCETCKEWKW